MEQKKDSGLRRDMSFPLQLHSIPNPWQCPGSSPIPSARSYRHQESGSGTYSAHVLSCLWELHPEGTDSRVPLPLGRNFPACRRSYPLHRNRHGFMSYNTMNNIYMWYDDFFSLTDYSFSWNHVMVFQTRDNFFVNLQKYKIVRKRLGLGCILVSTFTTKISLNIMYVISDLSSRCPRKCTI